LETEEKQLFVSRLLHLPVVATAMDQVNALYTTTKQRNSLIKRTMETAETGVSAVYGTAAAPVILMFDKPLTSLNGFACDQLDKLENKYPIITKPTEEVVKATKDLCNTAVKPFVDRVSSAKQFGYDKVSDVRSFTGEKLGDMKSYGWTTVESVVQLGNDQMSRVLTTVTQHRLTSVDDLLETADQYVDSYLPPDEEDEAKEKEQNKESGEENEGEEKEGGGGEKEEDAKGSVVVVSKAFQLGSKVQKRLWSQALKQMKRIQLRSRETLQKLNFSVDLIEYARTNFNEAKDKMESIWTEVNKTDEEIAKEETDEKEKTTEEKKKSGLERKAIEAARQLTLRLKSTLSWLPIPHFIANGSIPEAVTGQIRSLQEKTQALVNIFSKEMDDGKELTESALGRARNLTTQIYAGVLGLVSHLIRYGEEKKELIVKDTTKSEEEMKPLPTEDEKDDQLSNNSQEDN